MHTQPRTTPRMATTLVDRPIPHTTDQPTHPRHPHRPPPPDRMMRLGVMPPIETGRPATFLKVGATTHDQPGRHTLSAAQRVVTTGSACVAPGPPSSRGPNRSMKADQARATCTTEVLAASDLPSVPGPSHGDCGQAGWGCVGERCPSTKSSARSTTTSLGFTSARPLATTAQPSLRSAGYIDDDWVRMPRGPLIHPAQHRGRRSRYPRGEVMNHLPARDRADRYRPPHHDPPARPASRHPPLVQPTHDPAGPPNPGLGQSSA